MSLEELNVQRADLRNWAADLKRGQGPLDLRQVLVDFVIPFMEGIASATYSELEEQAGAIIELIDTHDDIIHPELGAKIAGTISLGQLICQILEENEVVLENELANKRLQDAVKTYKRNAVMTLERVAEATTLPDEDDDEEDDEDLVEDEPSEDVEEEADTDESEAEATAEDEDALIEEALAGSDE